MKGHRTTYEKWKQLWRISPYGERLGQAFVNDFFGNIVTIDIFNESDYWKADELITQWLIDNCHYPYVPEEFDK
jgi:hypothetical protein